MHANGSNGHPWHDAIVDAGIAGGAAAFGGLMVVYATTGTLPTVAVLYGALLAFGVAFYASLMAARGRGGTP